MPPALLVLATDGRLLEMTLRVDGLDAAGFLAMLLLPPDLLPALLLDDRDDRDEPPDEGRPKREELVLERLLAEEEEEELTSLAEIKARLIFLMVLRKFSSSVKRKGMHCERSVGHAVKKKEGMYGLSFPKKTH